MQPFLLRHQITHRLPVHLIRHASISRTNRRTLRLLMKPLTLRTFIRNDIVKVIADRSVPFPSLYNAAVQQRIVAFYVRPIFNRPINTRLIDRIVRTLRQTRVTNNTILVYLYRHLLINAVSPSLPSTHPPSPGTSHPAHNNPPDKPPHIAAPHENPDTPYTCSERCSRCPH